MTHRLIPALLVVNWLLLTAWFSTGRPFFAEASIIIVATNATLPTRSAAFGPRIPDDGLEGHMIPLVSYDPTNKYGCSSVALPHGSDWVALVERGNCSFVEKIRNMQASGAIGVAVGDNEKNSLTTMFPTGDASDILIPSLFLAQQQYHFLLQLFNQSHGKPLHIEMVDDDFQWPILDVIIVVILSPTIMMIFVYTLWRVRAQQRRKKELAPVQVVDNLPTKIFYKEKRKENEPEECVICLDDFVDEDELRVLPCKHEFHIPCIDGWLTTRKKFCPICKRDVCPDLEATAPTEHTPLLNGNSSTPVPVTPTRIGVSNPNNTPPAAASQSSSS